MFWFTTRYVFWFTTMYNYSTRYRKSVPVKLHSVRMFPKLLLLDFASSRNPTMLWHARSCTYSILSQLVWLYLLLSVNTSLHVTPLSADYRLNVPQSLAFAVLGLLANNSLWRKWRPANKIHNHASINTKSTLSKTLKAVAHDTSQIVSLLIMIEHLYTLTPRPNRAFAVFTQSSQNAERWIRKCTVQGN